MEVLEITSKTVDATFVYKKLTDTIAAYRAQYPELGYILSGIKLIKKEGEEEDSIELLEKLSHYIWQKLFDYYAIKIIHHKFWADVQALEAGNPVNREKELYLEFTLYKDHAPIK